jgi:hypothetical protein
MVKPH